MRRLVSSDALRKSGEGPGQGLYGSGVQ